MNNFVIDTPDNFWQIRWLDKYMEGHKGFIAGGCFKNILSGERVKDIDIFFESESDFQEAIDSFNDEKHQKEGWKFKYRNEKVCAFQKEGENYWSSTESSQAVAWYVVFSSGLTGTGNKHIGDMVRTVIDF